MGFHILNHRPTARPQVPADSKIRDLLAAQSVNLPIGCIDLFYHPRFSSEKVATANFDWVSTETVTNDLGLTR